MHYFDFNIKDYSFATMHFDYVHHGAYLKLISLYYESEKPLPLDVNEIILITQARKEEEVNAVKYILEKFFTKTEDGYIQKRCDAEIQAFKNKSDKAKKAINTRWNKEKDTDVIQTYYERNTKQEPVNNKQKTKTIDTPSGVDESVWKDYLKIRKAKDLPITETALKGIEREAAKAGKTLNEVITICCENSWAGFKAEWLDKFKTEAASQKWPGK
jgi:uncharacterized protein YdaU (DUF1376 family)